MGSWDEVDSWSARKAREVERVELELRALGWLLVDPLRGVWGAREKSHLFDSDEARQQPSQVVATSGDGLVAAVRSVLEERAAPYAGAVLSPCGLYRYSLTRNFGTGPRRVLFVMLNPSTADARQDDPTIRRCISFAEGWSFGSLDVVNLFAGRTPRPDVLFLMGDPVGPENDRHIREAAGRAELIVAAWGADPRAANRAKAVLDGPLAEHLSKLHVLRWTAAGAPGHPLYVPKAAPLLLWEVARG